MDDPISRAEHEEFAKRIEAENNRQNKRIDILEESIGQIHEMTVSIKELSTNMDSMCKELSKQGERLEKLEGKDGEMWRAVVKYALTAVIGILVGYIFTTIGM